MTPIKIFLDTEFTSLTQYTQLMSLALVAETGETFYAELTDFDANNVSDFVRKEVLDYFYLTEKNQVPENLNALRVKTDKKELSVIIQKWLKQFGEKTPLQFWADVPHYDWVLFCELFGGSMNLPENISYMCMDLATLLWVKGINPDTKRIELIEKKELSSDYKIHNALSDAELGMNILKKYTK